MSPEERSLLEETNRLVKENNQILASMRRTGRIHLTLRVLYWVIIIGLSVGAIYFVQPYFNFLTNLGGGSNLDAFQDLLK